MYDVHSTPYTYTHTHTHTLLVNLPSLPGALPCMLSLHMNRKKKDFPLGAHGSETLSVHSRRVCYVKLFFQLK